MEKMGSNSDIGISAILDRIMEDEEKKSKKKQKDLENLKKKENPSSKEQFKTILPHYGPPAVGHFPAYPNHNEMHLNLQQAHPMGINIAAPHSLPPNSSVPPQFFASYSQIPPMPINNEMPIGNANAIVSSGNPPVNTIIPPHEHFPPPMNHNPEVYGTVPPNILPNSHHQKYQTFPEPNSNLLFPIDTPNLSNFSSPYNSTIPCIENDDDKKRKKAKTNSLPHSFIASTLPPPPSPPKLGNYSNSSKIATSTSSYNSPKRPFTPPNCPTREFSQKQKFYSENNGLKTLHSPRYSDAEKKSHHTPNKTGTSLEPYEEKRSSYDKKERKSRDRRENSYERRNKSEKDYMDKKHHSETSHRYDKYGKRSRSREADHRSVNKHKNRKPYNELICRDEPQNNINSPQPPFHSFSECPPFTPVLPSPFNPIKQDTSYPVVEGMPFPPPGLNFTPVNQGPHFNHGRPPFEHNLMGIPPPFSPMQRPPLNPIHEVPLNVVSTQPHYNHVSEPSFVPIDGQTFNNNYVVEGKEKDFPYLEGNSSTKPSSSRSHKTNYDKLKRKHHKELKKKVKPLDKNKKSKSKRKRENYELEPGECISDSFTDDDDSSSSYDDSDSEDSSSTSSTSSNTDDSLYKFEFLNKKQKTTHPDVPNKEAAEDNTNNKSVEKPKFPRYFKDRVAYCDDTSLNNLEEQELTKHEENPVTKVEDSKILLSPSIVSESLKAAKTPLIKRLGLAQNGEQITKDENEYDTVNSEASFEENAESAQFSSCEIPETNDAVRTDISPFTFEQYLQRSSSLSPNNSLDFEEYKLLVSTKEILTASKSIFKSPTSPKSTTTKKKYEKPIIKVETASKPAHYNEVKESPQRIDLDSRIRLMFGMKSSCDNSPEKKNFRNAAFSYKSMRLLTRPPSPFRNRSAYQFWHRETYYFRKNNPIPDYFSDPTQRRKFEIQSKGLKPKKLRFPNLKEDYYQSREIKPRQPIKLEGIKGTKELDESSVRTDHKVDIKNKVRDNDSSTLQDHIVKQDHKEAKSSLILSRSTKHDIITKINVSPDTELELISENPSDSLMTDNLHFSNINEKSDLPSDDVVQVILNRIVEELKHEIKNKLTENILEETLKINEESSENKTLKHSVKESGVVKGLNKANKEEELKNQEKEVKDNKMQVDKSISDKHPKIS